MRTLMILGLAAFILTLPRDAVDAAAGTPKPPVVQAGDPSTPSRPHQVKGISTLKTQTMGELIADGGTHLQLIDYEAADGIKLQSIHGMFESPTDAKEYLEKKAAKE
jgi:hypothetical protein